MTGIFHRSGTLIACLAMLMLSACVAPRPYDYTAFRASQPKSILVLPPLNNTPEVLAGASFLSHVSYPLGEAGYYVFPVAVVDETFRQNGLLTAADIHAVPATKLREIFGADSALYITVTQFGTRYFVLASETRVTAQATLVDLKSGDTLWSGSATASNDENNRSSGNLIAALVVAAVKQIVNTVSEQGHQVAGITSQRLLTVRPNGILPGPRSPQYGQGAQPPR